MHRDEESDEQLMRQLREGDDSALNELIRRWKNPVIAFLLRSIGDRETALDLAQETFIRLYRARSRYRAKAHFTSWIFTIAANLARNHARWRKRHPTVPLEEGGGNGESAGTPGARTAAEDSPDAATQRSDRAELVRRAVAALPHDLRTAILLFEFEGLSHAEIASVFGCSEKAVEMRLYRARKRLRQRLGFLLEE